MTKPLPPVVFFNPNLFAPIYRIGVVNPDASRIGFVGGQKTADAFDAFASLVHRIRAVVVGTASMATGFDPRDMLLNRGLRATWGADWFACASVSARYSEARAWLARNGDRPAIILDRPPAAGEIDAAAPRGSIIVSIPDGVELTAAHCDRAAALIGKRMTAAA